MSASKPTTDATVCKGNKKKNAQKKMLQKEVNQEEDLSKIMAECSSTAQALKKNITDQLESLAGPKEQNVESLDDTNVHIKEILEKSIKEKLSELEEALKQESYTGINEPQFNQQPSLEFQQSVTSTAVEEVAISPARVEPSLPENVAKERSESPKKKADSKKSVKDRLTVERVLKNLNNLSTDEAKLEELAGKYVDICDNNRTVESKAKQQEKIMIQAIREKEQLQNEHNRLVLAKSRLENLCRELQRQNKVLKEESLSRLKEEEAKRRDIATRFQGTLKEIMQLVTENQETNVSLRKENSELASKLKLLMDHYEVWEQNVHKIIERKELEVQLVTAKMAQSNLLFNQEKEQLLTEKQELYMRLAELQQKGILMTQTELHLKEELAVYTNKYQEFQSVLNKSNDNFASFKKDMEKMSKEIKKYQKETVQWKARFENTNGNLAKVSQENKILADELAKAKLKNDTLEKLCRALQKDRGQPTNDNQEPASSN